MPWVVGGRAMLDLAASTSQMGRFETGAMTSTQNLTALADVSGRSAAPAGGPTCVRGVNSHRQCATDSRAFSLKMRHQLPEDPSRFSATGSGADGESGDSVRGLPRI